MSQVNKKVNHKLLRIQSFANLFGGSGYLAALLAWAWTAILFLPLLLESKIVDKLTPQPAAPPEPVASAGLEVPNLFAVIFGVTMVVIMIALSAYLLYKIPSRAVKKSSAATNRAAQLATPLVLHGKKLPIKKQRALSARLAYYLKLCLSTLPIIATLIISYFSPHLLPLDPVICLLSVGALSGVAIVGFWLQLLIAKLGKVKLENLV